MKTKHVNAAPVSVPSTALKSGRRKSKFPNRNEQICFAWLGGALPVIPGETEDDYETVSKMIIKSVGPANAIEYVLAKDLADAVLEIERLKRFKSFYLERKYWDQSTSEIEQIMTPDTKETRRDLARKFMREMANDCNGLKEVSTKLHRAGVKPRWIAAEAAWHSMDVLERFDGLLQAVERRRDKLLRQLGELQEARQSRSTRKPTAKLIDLDADDVTDDDL